MKVAMNKHILLPVFLLPVIVCSVVLAQNKGPGFTTSPTQGNWYDKSVALVVGINKYSNGWSSLAEPRNDAKRVADALKSQGFEVITLVDGQATKDAIMMQIQTYIPAKVGKNGRFVFYYSGHGQTQIAARTGRQLGYLVPSDGRKLGGVDDWSSYISMNNLRAQINNMIPAKHVLIVFDSCFSGTALTKSGSMSGTVNHFLGQPAINVLTAGDAGQPTPDGAFSYDFVNAINGSADGVGGQQDGYVTFAEVGIYLQGQIPAKVVGLSPSFGWWDGTSQMVFRYSDESSFQSTTDSQFLGTKNSTQSNLIEMVKIKPGRFIMGSVPQEAYFQEDKLPVIAPLLGKDLSGEFSNTPECQNVPPPPAVVLFKPVSQSTLPHWVRITKPFFIGAYEVTQAQWIAVMGSNPSSFGSNQCFFQCGENCPVENVSWYQAVEFCNRLSKIEKLDPCYQGVGENVKWDKSCNGYRLPTEAEWEYAARANSKTSFYSGKITEPHCGNDPMLSLVAWYCGNSMRTNRVGQKLPNSWGLFDMHGNVMEWVWDWYGHYSSDEATDPNGPQNGTKKVLRGGSWNSIGRDCRSASRYSAEPNKTLSFIGQININDKSFKYTSGGYIGFRVVRSFVD